MGRCGDSHGKTHTCVDQAPLPDAEVVSAAGVHA
jgi:hypothetical protein